MFIPSNIIYYYQELLNKEYKSCIVMKMNSREKTIEQIKNFNYIRSSYYKNSSQFKADEYQEKAVHIKYKIDEYYDGEINDNYMPHCQGVLQYANGDYYVGEFNNGLKEGLGQYNYNDGITYVGCWKNDLKEGDGTVTNKKQQWEFIGQFNNDKPIEGYLDIYSDKSNEDNDNNELNDQIKKIKLKEVDIEESNIIHSNEKVNIDALRSPMPDKTFKKRKILHK